MRIVSGARRARSVVGGNLRAERRGYRWGGVSLIALSVAAGLLLPPAVRADQLPASAFQTYNPATASSIVAGPFALYTVPVNQLLPTQQNLGFNEVDKKAAAFNLVTTAAGPVSLATATPVLDNANNLLGSIEPVVIGPGGVLYQTDGHHTFRALLDSAYGASDPTVYVNVIANFSNMTQAQFFAAMEADNLLFPVNDGTFDPVNLSTGAPLPSSLLGMTSDPYRGLEYSILKNKNSKLFTTTSNISGVIGSAIPGLDKITGFYSDFIWGDAYRGALGGLGLPYLSPGDIAFSTHWNLTGTNTTTGIPGFPTLSVDQLPGYILPTGMTTINPGTVTNASITASGNAQLGALSGDGTFDGLRNMIVGGGGQSVVVGTQQAPGVGPGFLLQLGNDNNTSFATDNDSVTLNAGNSYTGGTTIIAGRLIITSDSSLGAAGGSTAINLNSIAASIEADNGIIFNSLTEGNGTIQLGSSTTPGQNSITESRPIELDGEEATINLNGNTLTLTNANNLAGGQLYSAGSVAGISNADGEADITIDDDSAADNGKLILGTTANPNFYGNWIIGNNGAPTLEVFNDASLGNTSGPSYEIPQIELNGGTLQTGASFSAVNAIFLAGGSDIDVDGNATTWGSLQDTQRTLTIVNSGAAQGSIGFGTFEFNSTAILNPNAGTGTAGGPGTIVNLGTITRGDNFANAAASATLFIDPAVGSTLGSAAANGVEVLAAAGQAATTNVNGIVPSWIITDSAGAASSNPYNFVTYNATNGYQIANYSDTGSGTTGGLATATSTSVVEQTDATATTALSANAAAYALKVDNTENINEGGNTITIGDGTDPAGLILEGTTTISNGTVAFGASEAVIDVKATNTISSAVTGTGGLTLSGSGTLVLSGTAGGLSGPIDIDSGTLQLNTANYFNSGTTLWLSNVKSKPSNAILILNNASQTFSGLDSDGTSDNNNIQVNGTSTLTVGDGNNWNSTLGTKLSGSSTQAGILTKAGLGLLDLTGSTVNFTSNTGSILVNAGALRIGNGVMTSTNPFSVASGAELQYSGNGGSVLSDAISGAGIFHLLAGTVQLSGTNTYTGGTVLEIGSTLDIKSQSALPAGGNVANAGGILNFDVAAGTSITYAGVMSDGIEAGGPNDLNDIAGATTNLGAANFAAAACGSNGSSANPEGPTCLSGNLIKDDSTNDNAANSNLLLSAQQLYSGFTAVEAGTLTLGTTNTISNSSGVILGRVGGPIDSQTAGLVLAANNSIQGLASNPSSTATAVNPSVSVQLAGNTLTIAPPSGFANTFGGNILDSGTGALVEGGSGLQVLDGTNTVNGSTTVTSGALQIGDANTPSATLTTPTVTVGAAGTLLGHGTITGNVINTAGGVVAPGGTIGTLSVAGNYTQSAASSLAIEINGTTASKLAVTGTATIAGTLAVLPDASTYSRGMSYQVLTAAGGVTGTYATLANAEPQLVFNTVYKTDEVDLLLTKFAPATTLTGNEQGVFNALNNTPIGSATDTLLNTIGNLSASAQPQALNALNAYSAASNLSVMTIGMSTFQDAIGGRASADPEAGSDVQTAQLVTDDWLPIPANTYTVWTQGLGQFGTRHGTSNAPGETSSIGGGVMGIDTAIDPATRVGASFGATTGGVSVQGVGQSGTINSYALGVYGGRWFGPLGFDAEAMGAYNTSTSTRFIAVNNTTAKGSTSGFGGGLSGAARYRMDLPLATIEPQLGLEYTYSSLGSYTETGAGVADLNVGATSQNSLRTGAGAEIFRAFSDPAGYTIVPEMRAAWLHQFLDTTPTVNESFAATPSAAFSTTGVDVGRDAALLEAGLSFKAPGTNVSFYAQYDATLSSRAIDHTIRGGFAFYW